MLAAEVELAAASPEVELESLEVELAAEVELASSEVEPTDTEVIPGPVERLCAAPGLPHATSAAGQMRRARRAGLIRVA